MYTVIGNGHQEVSISGSPVKLVPNSVPANRVDIQAKYTNTGEIYIGGPNIQASLPNGVGLKAGDVYSLEKITDLVTIFLDSTVNGEGVTYTWFVGEIN